MNGASFPRWNRTEHPTLAALRLTAAAIIAVALVAVGAAIAVGRLMGTAAAPVPAVEAAQRSVRAGAAELSVPRRWAPATLRSAAIPGLAPALTATLASSPGLGARVVVTLAPGADPSLVPAALRASLAGRLPAPRATNIAGRPAWLYAGLALPDRRQMDVSVVPTSAGVLAVACVAPSFAWSAAFGCADEVRALRLPGASFFAPARNLSFRLHLPAVAAALDRARVAGRQALRAARTRPGQARAARRLARAHTGAAAAVRPLAGPDGAALVSALAASASAYSRLATAAERGWPVRYRLARRAVMRADARVAAALHAVA